MKITKKYILLTITLATLISHLLPLTTISAMPKRTPYTLSNHHSKTNKGQNNKNKNNRRPKRTKRAYAMTQPQANILLLNAAYHSNIQALRIALQHGAELNTVNAYGDTALHIAVTQKNYTLMHILLNTKAPINALDIQDFTPLTIAVANNDLTATKMLLIAGADSTIPTIFNLTPLDYARGTLGKILSRKSSSQRS